MRRTGPVAMLAAVAAMLGGSSRLWPYAFYTHYQNQAAPYSPIPERYDLSALPNQTLSFFVSDAGPEQILFSANDSFSSVLGAVRQAAQVWDSVNTSALRVAFGGLESGDTAQNTPGVDIVFDDVPPGLLAYTTHKAAPEAVSTPSGSFVPITRATVHISRDLTRLPGPSYSELFFTTTLHEMGHALGLQHTFTSSVMSTAITRSTSRAMPLGWDDIVGVSLLYPKNGFPAGLGSITGRVTAGGQGVHLASVVALRTNGTAVSALTDPDGNYRIDGLPLNGTYQLYVHPLPPDADITPPLDSSGQPVPASGPVETVFYSGASGTTRDPNLATPVIFSGTDSQTADFAVQPKNAVGIYDISLYSFFGQNPVHPAYIAPAATTNGVGTVVAVGVGITTPDARTVPGLSVQIMGGFGPTQITAYDPNNPALAIYFQFPLALSTGTPAVVFSTPDDTYVLPGGLRLLQKQPPQISSVTPNGDGTVTIAGRGLIGDSRIFFDSLPAQAVQPVSGDEQSGTVVAKPPAGSSGQVATVTVFNADGQNSMFTAPQAAPTYTYPEADAPVFTVTPTALAAGNSAMVDVTTPNMHFANGQVSLGFGSSDVLVRQTWVLGPDHLLANVTVLASAAVSGTEISVVSGFAYATQPATFQIQQQNPSQPGLALPVINPVAGQTGLYPGGYASIFGSNLAKDSEDAIVTLNDRQVPVLYSSPSQINFQIPLDYPLGLAALRVNNGLGFGPPVVISVTSAPPVLSGILSAASASLDATKPATAGDSITLVLTNLDPSVLSSPSRLKVTESGTPLMVGAITAVEGQSNLYQVQVTLAPGITGDAVPVVVVVDGNSSNSIDLAVRSTQ